MLLVSSDFIAPDYCYDKEMTRAMSRDEAFRCIAVGIRRAAEELRERGQRAAPPRPAVGSYAPRTREELQTDLPNRTSTPHRTRWRPDSHTLLRQGPHIEAVISRSRLDRGDVPQGAPELAIRALIDTGARFQSSTRRLPQPASLCRSTGLR